MTVIYSFINTLLPLWPVQTHTSLYFPPHKIPSKHTHTHTQPPLPGYPLVIHSRLYNTVSVSYDGSQHFFLLFKISINIYVAIFGKWYICIYISLLRMIQIQCMWTYNMYNSMPACLSVTVDQSLGPISTDGVQSCSEKKNESLPPWCCFGHLMLPGAHSPLGSSYIWAEAQRCQAWPQTAFRVRHIQALVLITSILQRDKSQKKKTWQMVAVPCLIFKLLFQASKPGRRWEVFTPSSSYDIAPPSSSSCLFHTQRCKHSHVHSYAQSTEVSHYTYTSRKTKQNKHKRSACAHMAKHTHWDLGKRN